MITDPHDGVSFNMAPPNVSADTVLVSHEHNDHASRKWMVLKPEGTLMDKPGSHTVKGVKVVGVATYHDEALSTKRGDNILFAFEVGSVRFSHLRDLGHVLSEKEVQELGPVDILMVPVGGYYTIDAKAATEIVYKIRPRVVIPMHYKLPALDFHISGVEAFLKGKANVKHLGRPEVNFRKAQLPVAAEIDIFSLPTP